MTFDLDARTSSRLAEHRRKYRDVVQLNAIQAILGDENGAISDPSEPYNYLVRIDNGENSDGSTQYGHAFPILSGIYMGSEEVGTPVIIGIAHDGVWAILGIDRTATVEAGRNPRADNVNSPYRRFTYMRDADLFWAVPMGTQQTQTMEVRVEPSPYINDSGVHTTFVGGLIDLAGDIPAADGDGNSQHLISAVFVNSSGVLESKTSTAKLIDDELTWAVDVVEAFGNRTARALAVRYYRLFTGHVLLTKADEFGDGRPWITGPTRRNNFAATTAPTVNDDIDLRYEVGSKWHDVTNDRFYVCLDSTDGAAVWQNYVKRTGDTMTGDLNMGENAITNFDQIAMKSAVEATISSGEITITEGHIKVDTEGDAADDDLDTINSTQSGEILFLLPEDDARTVRIRNAAGNIFLKHQVDSHHFAFSSPAGAGAATRYAGGGWYDFATTDVTLNQGSLTQTFGTANVSYAAHASIITGAAGTVDTGTVSIVVSGTSIDDEGNRSAADSETILADITTASTDAYYETVKKWLGTITFTLTETVADPTAYTIDFNYGLSKYEDFGNQTFTVTGLQVAGEAGASDTGFNMILFYHSPAGWTYAAAGFVPGGTQLANMNTDHSTEQNLANGEPFAWKRTDLNTDVDGSNGQGVVFRVDTSAAKAVESMSGVIWVHTQPAFSYLSDTKQHLIFMKHGSNFLEL